MAVVNRLMEMDPLTTDTITEFLTSCFTVMLVTRDKHTRLNASGLRSTMPLDWDGADIFARYTAVGIEPATAPICK